MERTRSAKPRRHPPDNQPDAHPASPPFTLSSGLCAHYRVQPKLKGAAAPAGADAMARAAVEGTSGASRALPHLELLQRLFGRHDLGQVRAYTDERAAVAAGSIGAEAFASGEQVVFNGAPSLHTAAHEAAHVIQQRAGAAGEAHADAVADGVVRGESVEALLDSAAGTAAGVQRKIGFGYAIYGSEPSRLELPFEALLTAVQLYGLRLGAEDQAKLRRLFDDHQLHPFQDLDALLRDQLGMLGGLHDPRWLRDGAQLTEIDQSRREWFLSDNVKSARPPEELTSGAADRATLCIQLAVCGGEITRLVLGGLQPEMRHTQREGRLWRASSAVEGYHEFPFEIEDESEEGDEKRVENSPEGKRSGVAVCGKYPLLQNGKVWDEEMEKPIEGMVALFATALFLGDVDLNAGNIGLVRTRRGFEAVKIDPEASFSEHFFDNHRDRTLALLCAPHLAESGESFNFPLADLLEENLGEMRALLFAGDDAPRQRIAALHQIVAIDWARYEAVVDRCLSDEFAAARRVLKAGLAARLELFAEVLAELRRQHLHI